MVQSGTTLAFAVESFLIDCQARRLTKKTLKYYSKNLRTLTRYLTEKQVQFVERLTVHDLHNFMLALRKKECSAQYQHNIYRSIRTFFNFCVSEGIIEESPLTKMRAPKLPTHEITAFTCCRPLAYLHRTEVKPSCSFAISACQRMVASV